MIASRVSQVLFAFGQQFIDVGDKRGADRLNPLGIRAVDLGKQPGNTPLTPPALQC